MNDLDLTNVPKIQKPMLRIRKPKGSDIEWSNPCGDQATHFVGLIESPNVENSFCNCKKHEPHVMQGLQYAYHSPMKGKHK
jgi:hypothetical protein